MPPLPLSSSQNRESHSEEFDYTGPINKNYDSISSNNSRSFNRSNINGNDTNEKDEFFRHDRQYNNLNNFNKLKQYPNNNISNSDFDHQHQIKFGPYQRNRQFEDEYNTSTNTERRNNVNAGNNFFEGRNSNSRGNNSSSRQTSSRVNSIQGKSGDINNEQNKTSNSIPPQRMNQNQNTNNMNGGRYGGMYGGGMNGGYGGYGGGMYGMGMGMGMSPMMMGPFSWIYSLNNMIHSIPMMMDVLGMNSQMLLKILNQVYAMLTNICKMIKTSQFRRFLQQKSKRSKVLRVIFIVVSMGLASQAVRLVKLLIEYNFNQKRRLIST